jgi:fibronectin-binding autotransporter adhesin
MFYIFQREALFAVQTLEACLFQTLPLLQSECGILDFRQPIKQPKKLPNHQAMKIKTHQQTVSHASAINRGVPMGSLPRSRKPQRRAVGTSLLLVLSILGVVPGMQAALRTWNGGGADSFWGTVGNWGGTAPANGDDLLFSGSTRLGNSNSIVSLRINSLSYNGSGFTNIGQALMITNGIVDVAGGNTNLIPLILGGSQSFSNLSSLTLVLSGTINMSNYNLTASSSGGGNLFLNGVISGNGLAGLNALNVYDGLVRLGALNTFKGGLNINSGTVMLGNAGAIPSGNSIGNLNIASGATLDLGNQSPTVNGLTGSGVVDEVTTNAGNYIFTLGTANSNGVFSGSIVPDLSSSHGVISLVKNGTGTQTNSGNNNFSGSLTVNGGNLTLGGANTYVGSTIINAGTLVLDTLGSIVSTNINVAPGGVFNVSAVAGGFILNGNLIGGRASGFTNDFIGSLTMQNGNITVVPGIAGTLTLAGNLSLSGGTLNFDLNNVTTIGAGVNDLINLTNGGNLDLSGGLTLVKIKPIGGALSGGTYTLISGSTADVAGGPGNLQLAAPRGITATFDTTTQPKNLLVTASGAPNPASIVWAGNGAGGPWDVQVSQNFLSNGVPDFFYDLDTVTFNDAAGTANGTVNIPNAVSPTAVTINNSAFNYTLGVANSDPGLISGTGSLIKNGTGSVTLNTPNNYTGTTTVNGGGIVLGNYVTGAFGNEVVLYNGVTPGTVVLGNGGLFMTGVASTIESVECMLTINPGGSGLGQRSRQSNGTPFWTIDKINRNVGGTLDMNNIQQRAGSHVGIYFTNATDLAAVNGILGGYATWNLNDWIVPLNTLVGANPYAAYQVNATSSLWGAFSNVNVTASPSAIASSQVINSMKISAAATVTINSGQSLTLTSGGLLLPNNTTGSGVITGGTLMGATNADLIILQNAGASTLTIGSVIADNTNNAATSGSALTKAGQGTALLTGNNTYSGITYINGASLSGNGNGNNLPTFIAAGTLQIGSGGTSGGISNSPSVADNGTLAFSRSDTVGYSGLISGTGGVKQQGSGTSILTANNTYSGVTTITAGTLQIGNGGASGSFSNSASVANAGTLVINRTGTLAYAGQISGIGALAVQGGATFVLNTNETYTGTTIVSNGNLVLAASGSISNSPSIAVAAGAVLDASAAGGIALNSQVLSGNGGYVGNVTSGGGTRISPSGDGLIGTLTFSNSLTLNGGTVTIDVNGALLDLLDVKGNLNLASGTIALNNLGGPIANGAYKLIGYSGTLSGSAANLGISGFSQFGQLATLTDTTAGEIDLVVVTYIANNLIWQGDGVNNLWNTTAIVWTNGSGTLTNFHQFDNANFDDTSANTAVNLIGNLQPSQTTVNGTVNSYTFQGAGQLASGNLIMNNPNTLTLLTTNSSSGITTITAGTVQLGNGTADGMLGGGSVINNSALVLNEIGNETFGGAISGNGTINVNGTGAVLLTGNNSGFSGPMTINGGTLQVGSGGAAGTLGTGPVTNNTALVINRSGSLTVNSSIAGTGPLTNSGAGTVTLSGVNTYAGRTIINSGTVKAGSSTAIPSGAGDANVVLNGGASAATTGILDLNGFNININGLDGVNNTVLGQVVNNSGTATNTLTLGNGDATGTFSGTIRDNSGSGGKVALIKTGAGTQTLDVPTALGNLYSGGTIISNGTITITSPGGTSPVNVGASSVALGSGPVTFYGGTLSVAGSLGQSTSPTWNPGVGNTVIIPAGQTGTVNGCQRGPFSPTLLGGGTFNYLAAYVRGSIGGNWSGFTGQIIMQQSSGGGQVGINSTTGFYKVYCTNFVTLYNTVAGTPTIPFGELADDGTATIESTTSGNAGGVAAIFAIGSANTSTNFGGSIIDNVGITKVGTGALIMTNANITYTGPTTISNGVLVLTAAIPNSSTWSIVDPGALDISSNTASTTLSVGVASAQTIRGNGTLNGSLALGGSGTAVVGFTNAIGTLTVTNDANLGGTVYMELNRTNAVGGTNDQIAAATIELGGALTVTNIGPALHVGDTFKLFNATASGGLTGTIAATLPATDGNGMAYTWTDTTTVNGSITVLTAVSLVNQTPTNIVVTVSGNQLTLTWPTDHTGWRLQVQTNSVNTGLSGNWVDVTGSTIVNTMTFTLDPANGTVFYRMVYP